MLVVSRKTHESIIVDVQGTPIMIHVLGIHRGTASGYTSIGIDAPQEWKILRSELTKFD